MKGSSARPTVNDSARRVLASAISTWLSPLPTSLLLPLLLLWLMLAVNSWRHAFPVSEAAFFLTFAAAALFRPRNVPGLLLLPLYAPLAFAVPRPYVISFCLLAAVGVFRGRFRHLGRLLATPLMLSMAGYLAFCTASGLVTPATHMAMKALEPIVEGLAFVLLLMAFLDSPRALVMAIKVIAFLAGLAFIISLVNSLWRDQMWATRYYIQAATAAGVKLQDATGKYSIMYGTNVVGNRIIYAGLEPNYWGAVLQFPFWLAVGLVGASTGWRPKACWAVIAILVLLGILGTYSRASFLTLLGTGLLFVAWRRERSIALLSVMVASGWFLLARSPLLVERLRGIEHDVVTHGGSQRLDYWRTALTMWSRSPLWGSGLLSYVAAYGHAVHNTYLQLLAELGLVGLALYLVVICIGLWSWWQSIGMARGFGSHELVSLAEGGLLGTVGTLVNIGSITAQDVELVWLPLVVGFALFVHLRKQVRAASVVLSEPLAGSVDSSLPSAGRRYSSSTKSCMSSARPIRVVFFTSEFRPSRDHIFAQVLGQASALEDAGFECMLIGSEPDDESVRQALAMPQVQAMSLARVYSIYPGTPNALAFLKVARTAARMAQRDVDSWQPDAVYVRGITSYAAGRALARRSGARLVYDARGLVSEEAVIKRGRWNLLALYYRRLELEAARKADVLLCVSEHFRSYLKAKTGRDDILVVPSCVDERQFGYRPEARQRIRKQLGWSSQSPVVVYCGGMSVWQRIEDVLQLLADMKSQQPELKCLLLASDPARMSKLASQAGLADSDYYCLRAPHDAVPDWLSAADAGIILRHDVPVNNVASPVKIAEYLACGLPVICSLGIGDLSELVQREQVGVIIADGQADRVRKALELVSRVHREPGLRQEAQELVRARLTWSSHLDTYRAAYGAQVHSA